MNDLYTHYYSSSRHDGFINVISNCKGELNWKKEFSGNIENPLENRLILVSGDRLIIDNMSEILCVNDQGDLLWKRDKWYGTQVVIDKSIIYYISPLRNDRMESVTLDNKLVTEDFIIYEIIEDSHLVLFEPSGDEIIAQVQYSGVQEITTDKFVIYKIGKKSLGYDWSRIFLNESSPFLPLVNFGKEFLLTATHSDVMLFNIRNKKREASPEITFPVPASTDNLYVSSSEEGYLFFSYVELDKIILKCCDQKGNELYQVSFPEEFSNVNKVIAPPVLTIDNIYLLTQNKLICINDKKVIWTVASEGLQFLYATGLGDNSVLVAQGNLLKHFSAEGKQKFLFEAKEKVSAPPVVDKNGNVYFCTRESIFSLR